MSETDLTIIDQKPDEVVLNGRAAATELTKIVSSRPKKLVMAGKQYLFFEDWQTIGKFYGVTAKVVHTEELRDEGKLIGFLASAVAVYNGADVSGADAECTFDEPNWQGKPRFQLRSMAQTRACAKTLRNCLGWVAVLAGYEATPAEEADSVILQVDKTSHWCSEHETNFFKKGKMKGYAHKVEETGEWCNEGEEEQTPKEQPPTDLPIDMNWLLESCLKIKWSESTIKSYLSNRYHKQGTLEEILQSLSAEESIEFMKEVSDRLKMV